MTLLIALVFVASVSEEEVTKTVPGDCIDPGNEFDVTINTSDTGVVIKDALPGWTYKSSSLEAYQVKRLRQCHDLHTGWLSKLHLRSPKRWIQMMRACIIEGGFKDINQGEIPIQVTQITKVRIIECHKTTSYHTVEPRWRLES